MQGEPILKGSKVEAARGMKPWQARLDFDSGTLWPLTHVVTCHLSEMQGRYLDQEEERRLIETEDPLIYRADEISAPEEEGQLHTSVTVLYPGKVGDEYFMSKGHYHVREECVKVYVGVCGVGYLLMQTTEGEFTHILVEPGTVAYCPPYWAQRTVNIGDEPFAYYKYWPAQSGHDYERVINEGGFLKRVVERDSHPAFIDALP